MERTEKRRLVEALVLASPDPISAERIAAIVPHCKPSEAAALVEELNAEYREREHAFEIHEVAGGYRIRTLPEFAPWLQQLESQRALRLSRAALETLSLVAYRQPVTRAEIEHVRGVDAGAVLRSLLERRLVRIAGHREVPGRPMVYGTTRRFLEVFGLNDLKDLPALRSLEEVAAELAPRAAEGEASDAPAETGAPDETELEALDEGEEGAEDDGEDAPLVELH
jgi:segregation and condensation protein B